MKNFSGLYAPIITPFKEDESIDFDHLNTNLEKWLSQPLEGVIMPGSNSESAYLSDEEKVSIWKACAEVLAPAGKKLIAGTGVERTQDSIRLCETAAEIGADAALILPPNFFTASMTHELLVKHFMAVADVSPLPVLIYNMPAFTGIDLGLNTLVELAAHPNIIGIKDSGSNVIKMGSLLAACPDFLVFAGTGGALLPFLSIGAVGGVMALANFAVEPLNRLYQAFLRGDWAEARSLQYALMEINSAVTTRFGVPGLKYAMDQSGFYGGPCRKPLLPLSKETAGVIDGLLGKLKESGLL